MSALDGAAATQQISQQLAAALAKGDKPELSKAFVGFWNEVSNVWKDANNPHHKNDYATLEAVINKIKPVTKKYKLAIPQFLGRTANGQMELATMVVHESGQSWNFLASFPLADAGWDKNAGEKRPPGPQQGASASSYLRRYCLMALCGMTGTDDDDDGEAASEEPEPKKGNPKAVEEARAAIEAFKLKRKESVEDGLARMTEELEPVVRAAKDKDTVSLYVAKRKEIKNG